MFCGLFIYGCLFWVYNGFFATIIIMIAILYFIYFVKFLWKRVIDYFVIIVILEFYPLDYLSYFSVGWEMILS